MFTPENDLLTRYGDKLMALHLHDNDGVDDWHSLPFSGNVFKRGIKIMESMQEKKFYSNSVDFIMNDASFDNLSDEELLKMRDRISG